MVVGCNIYCLDLSIELDSNNLADSNYYKPIGYFEHSFYFLVSES